MPQQNNIYTVKELNERIQELVSGEPWLGSLGVEGEITGLGTDKRGHMYFSLKDPSGVLAAVMFAGKQVYGLKFAPKNGDKVHAFGHIDVFVRDGKYQLYVDRLVRVGDGEVNAKLERLIARLDGMGLFSQEYKKPIPAYPRRIGIVTAGAKAAISDIRAVAKRRDPYAQLYCYPATVQGQYAAADISRGIEILDSMGLDLIIVGRGGGSKEDLWAFNEESVARAIFACRTPVISAVGHETDVTIADYVADLRAPTPSAAAELAVFDYHLFEQQCIAAAQQMTKRMEQKAEQYAYRLERFRLRLQLHSPQRQLNERRQYLEDARVKMARQMEKKVSDLRHRLELVCSRMDGLSPLKKISGGYGFVTDTDGKRVETVTGLQAGDTLTVRLPDGRVEAEIREVYQENLPG